MNISKMPERVHGEWIWKSSLNAKDDAFLLLRKTFELDTPGVQNTLCITANCSYQLFINGRFAGFGPRAHHDESNYVDCYDISAHLQSGLNAIGVIVYFSAPYGPPRLGVPGLWCQLESAHKLILASDRTWMVRELEGFSVPRPRSAVNQLMTEYIDHLDLPENWSEPRFQCDRTWSEPDVAVPPGMPGSVLENYPLEPAIVDTTHEFKFIDRGIIDAQVAWTQVFFGNRHRNRRSVTAAESYFYSPIHTELTVKLYSDDPLRLFCNQTMVLSEPSANGTKDFSLPVKSGWNRLLLIQLPTGNSMGTFFVFPKNRRDSLVFRSAPSERASVAWKVAGPLKLSFQAATASLKLDRSPHGEYVIDPTMPIDVSNLLTEVHWIVQPSQPQDGVLKQLDFARFRLDSLRYGFPVINLEASAGDIVEVSLGYRLDGNGMPTRGNGIRGTHTLRCRDGLNSFMLFNPREILYMTLSVHHSEKGVRIKQCFFEELVRQSLRETKFNCSDELINRLWDTGLRTLRRSSAFVPQRESQAEYDVYLLDAYIDAVNMVAVFGDHAYASARLRQFIDAQFENGDIPALTFGNRQRSQAHHLFVLPVWMLYNFKTSGNRNELTELLPNLELLNDFFDSLINENIGLIDDIDHRFSLRSRLSFGNFGNGSVPTYINSLYCRFLLSKAEIHRLLNNPTAADKCTAKAKTIAGRLRELNFDPRDRLFVRKTEAGRSYEFNLDRDHNLFANFSALLGGVMDLSDFDHFFFSFFRYDAPFNRSDEAKSPYFHFFFLETMFALGQGVWTCRYFRDYWTKRLCPESGSWLTWQGTADPAPVRYYDGNVVSPNVFIIRELAGVRLADSGHSSIYFNPALSQLEWADLLFPTAFGQIHVRWQQNPDKTIDVLIDANYPIKVLPEMSPEQLKNTAFELSENVTLLQAPKK